MPVRESTGYLVAGLENEWFVDKGEILQTSSFEGADNAIAHCRGVPWEAKYTKTEGVPKLEMPFKNKDWATQRIFFLLKNMNSLDLPPLRRVPGLVLPATWKAQFPVTLLVTPFGYAVDSR